MMQLLIATLLLFGILHLVPTVAVLKSTAITALGKAYGPVYGIASLLALVAVVWSFRQVPPQPLYDVPTWGRHANFLLSFLGFLCLGIFIFRGSWRNRLRHPMALAVVLWAAGHLLANGDLATTVVFGGLAAIAVVQAVLRAKSGISVGPVREGHNLLSLLAGVALYGVAVQLHTIVAGVPVIQLH